MKTNGKVKMSGSADRRFDGLRLFWPLGRAADPKHGTRYAKLDGKKLECL